MGADAAAAVVFRKARRFIGSDLIEEPHGKTGWKHESFAARLALLLCIVAWERVYTINDFWDRPRRGVADVSGVPHMYESPFNNDTDDFEDFYFVTPIEPELLALVLEDWDIWNRWSQALDRGETSIETHPVLPRDRARHEELTNLIGTRFRAHPGNSRKLGAKFRTVSRGWDGAEVEWSEPEL
jgi:hypothetical protein